MKRRQGRRVPSTFPRIPHPAVAGPQRPIPSAVTFFVTAPQRDAILKRLRAIHPDRAPALLIALGLDPTGDTP